MKYCPYFRSKRMEWFGWANEEYFSHILTKCQMVWVTVTLICANVPLCATVSMRVTFRPYPRFLTSRAESFQLLGFVTVCARVEPLSVHTNVQMFPPVCCDHKSFSLNQNLFNEEKIQSHSSVLIQRTHTRSWITC